VANAQTPADLSEEFAVRYGSRILVLDRYDRVLLFESDGLGDAPVLWLPPGGGLEEGESHEDAARRELWEEIGLRAADLSVCVWERSLVIRWEGRPMNIRERYYVTRVEEIEISLANMEAHERSMLRSHRCWSQLEIIAAKDQTFVPKELGRLLQPLLLGEYPIEPIGLRT
jgi:8-oxo-dGTP pyrophosphatase MutT (NUDIX family)